MINVPRPVTKLTDEQRQLLAAAVESANRMREATEKAWADALTARNSGVPDDLLCDETGLSRSTLNRKYGPRPKPSEPE